MLPSSLSCNKSACNAGDLGLIPGSGRFPGEEKGHPLQYSCLENPKNRGVWKATVHVITREGHDLATKPKQLLYNVVLVSAAQQSESTYVLHIPPPPGACLPPLPHMPLDHHRAWS